ncbi:copia protein [Tanacetum coccineum]
MVYPKGFGIETIVYADSDHAGDYIDRKSTSGVCTFMGCCLTSWFSKKQTALAISTTEAEYVSAGKVCQQALWMKQALIDYGISFPAIRELVDIVKENTEFGLPGECKLGRRRASLPNTINPCVAIRRNLEAYVDDMVIRAMLRGCYLADIIEYYLTT